MILFPSQIFEKDPWRVMMIIVIIVNGSYDKACTDLCHATFPRKGGTLRDIPTDGCEGD